jgi:transposase
MGVVVVRKPIRELKLSVDERAFLEKIANTGRRSIKQARRARILLELDTSDNRVPIKDESIAEKVGVSRQTIQVVKKKYFVSGNINDVLERKKRETPPVKPKITGEVEARIIALACGAVPEGSSTWTLRLLADKVVELQILESISHVSISRLLKKQNLSPT